MKISYSLFALLLLILMSPLAYSASITDDLKEPATKLETFWVEPEKLIITDVYHLGDIREPAVGFEAISSYELGTKTKVRGIRVYSGTDKSRDRYFAFVDLDDFEGILKAVTTMIELNKEQQLAPDELRREAMYSCKGGFKIQMVKLPSQTRILLSGRYLALAFPSENLILLKNFLEKAQVFLNNYLRDSVKGEIE